MGEHQERAGTTAFLTLEKPEGYEVERISCAEFAARVGPVQQRVAWGDTFEVWDSRKDEPAFYVTLTGTNAVQEADQRSRYSVSHGACGGTKVYELLATETTAREVSVMTGKGTLTTTRSGRPRENVSPQAVAAEVEQLKAEVGGLKKVLAPAFKAPPPMRGTMSRGPGDHPREPYVMAQASSRSGDIWAGDYEHSQGFMDALKNGANIAELRQHSAEDKVMRATRQPPPGHLGVPEVLRNGRVQTSCPVPGLPWPFQLGPGRLSGHSRRPSRPAPCSGTGPSSPITSPPGSPVT